MSTEEKTPSEESSPSWLTNLKSQANARDAREQQPFEYIYECYNKIQKENENLNLRLAKLQIQIQKMKENRNTPLLESVIFQKKNNF